MIVFKGKEDITCKTTGKRGCGCWGLAGELVVGYHDFKLLTGTAYREE
jgi:hypothetical protein